MLGHFVAVIWHLLLLVKVQPSTPRFFPPLLILFNLFPIAGLVALAKGLRKLAGSLITLPLAIALVIGTYQISALLLVLLEALGCWIGIRIFAHLSARPALKT